MCKCGCKFLGTFSTFFTIRGAIIGRIWLEVIFATAFSALVVWSYDKYKWDVSVPQNVVDVIGVATGMLLVFRTNTSYDRFWEGRILWSELTTSIRTLIRTFWVMVDDKNDSKLIVEKLSVVNLLVAFAYATKHYLREEYSYEENDLMMLIGHLPHLLTPSTNETLKEQEQNQMDQDDMMARKTTDRLQTLSVSMGPGGGNLGRHSSVIRRRLDKKPPGTNIPLELTFYLSSFVKSYRENATIDAPTARVIDTSIGRMVHCLSGFERIRRTSIPVAYCVHLTHVTWIVLLLLPFHWTPAMGWYSVVVMAITSFAMLGILGIGMEIEDPFGYDSNDLNLDDYCNLIHKEAIAITAQPLPKLDSWMHTPGNRPVAFNSLNACELARLSPKELNTILFRGKGFKITDNRSDNRSGGVRSRAGSATDIVKIEVTEANTP